jgi:diguanylate cyclase (GGDEF)-like protein
MLEPIPFVLNTLLGNDERLRLGLKRTLLIAAVYVIALGMEWILVFLGRSSPRVAGAITAFIALGVAVFYATIRSGRSLRLRDPAMTMPQMVFGLVAMGLAYLINPQTRGAVLMLGTLAPMFGAFTLSRSRCLQLGWLAVAVFGAAMAFGAWRQPLQFPPQIEIVHFAFAALVLLTLAHIAGQLSELRGTQQQQKRELREAMLRLTLHASHDELTGLPNRRHLREWIGDAAARASIGTPPLCLALIDLDHFKRINDTLGHDVGDHTLRIFARESRSVLRAGDLLGRWGGEEFLLVMPATRPCDALVALARLRAHLTLATTWGECPLGRVTFSAGLAVHGAGKTVEQTVDRADQALYAAKHAGRDQVVMADPDEGPRPTHEARVDSAASALQR